MLDLHLGTSQWHVKNAASWGTRTVKSIRLKGLWHLNLMPYSPIIMNIYNEYNKNTGLTWIDSGIVKMDWTKRGFESETHLFFNRDVLGAKLVSCL